MKGWEGEKGLEEGGGWKDGRGRRAEALEGDKGWEGERRVEGWEGERVEGWKRGRGRENGRKQRRLLEIAIANLKQSCIYCEDKPG